MNDAVDAEQGDLERRYVLRAVRGCCWPCEGIRARDVYRLVSKYRALTGDDFKIVDGQDAYKHKVRAEIMRFKNKGLVRSSARGLYTVDKSRVLENAEKRLKTLCLSLNLPAERLREIERTSTVQERVKLLMQECKQQLATEATDA